MTVQEQKASEQKVQRAIQRRQLLADIREVMGTPAGRRVVWWILDIGNIFRACFTGNSTTFYNEGKRELTLTIFRHVMEAAPDQFHAAQRENWKPGEDDVNRRTE